MFQKIKLQLNQENFFLLIIFLLPLYLLRFSVFVFPANLWEVLAVVAIIFTTWKNGKNIVFSSYDKKIILLFSVIICGLIVGMIKSENYRASLGIIKGWFVIPFIFAFLASKVIANKKKAYLSLYFSAFLVAIIALIYKLTGAVTYDGRLEAFFNSPNYLAMYISPAIIIAAQIPSASWRTKFQIPNKLQITKSKIFYYKITDKIMYWADLVEIDYAGG